MLWEGAEFVTFRKGSCHFADVLLVPPGTLQKALRMLVLQTPELATLAVKGPS